MACEAKAFGTHYLRTAHIDAFGNAFQTNIGPFTEGLNVVYGPNEAGKTTTSTFIGGVLFGWPEARGGRNAYKPAGAQRSGTLVFTPRAGVQAEQEIECTRNTNAEGIKPNPNPAVLADIDEDTYRTIFSLNSDELLHLGRGSDITAHLLTAGAGTSVSPAQALAGVNEHISACFSTSAQYPDSISNLQAELAQTVEALECASKEAQTFKEEAREYVQLGPRLEEAQAKLSSLNSELEVFASQSSAIERLAEEAQQLAEEEQELHAKKLQLEQQGNALHRIEQLPELNDARLRSLREELDDFSDMEARLTHELDRAQDDYTAAKARFARLAESGAHTRQARAERRRRSVLTALSFALPAVFAIAAIFLFVLSRDSASTVPLVMAIVSGVAALVFAALGPVLLTRQGGNISAEEQRIEDATQDLNEAEEHLSLCAEKMDAHAATVAKTLEKSGLAAADGNIRYARALLEDVRESRSAQNIYEEQKASLRARQDNLDTQRMRNVQAQKEAYAILGLAPETPVAHIKGTLAEKTRVRQELQEQTKELAARYGQLESELERAKHMQEFDNLKLKHAQLTTRLEEAKEQYAHLLLVQRLLETSIKEWETKSQPEVYKRASALFSDMTGGQWCEVRLGEQNKLMVVDTFGQTLEPVYLSTGTCQQLYLALRIALLMTAENVGRSIPILADDILVNFDTTRRLGALRALEQLAQVRQVILFTCHEEVVRLMQDSVARVNLIEL